MNEFKTKYGPWALVTGASSGIGKEFARQLAANGINVAVAARRQDRLEELAQELENKHHIQTRAIPVDLTAVNYLDIIQSATADIEIGLLINNAGAGAPGAFLRQSLDNYTRVVQLNVTAPMQLTHIFGEQMIKQGYGGIIFISSIAGYMGSPYMANYAATKAYLLNLGAALHIELKSKGVDVLVVSPGPTRTEMMEMEGTDFSSIPMNWMEAGAVAAAGLQALGQKSTIIPGGMNKVMSFMATRVMSRQTALTMFGNMMAKGMDPAIL